MAAEIKGKLSVDKSSWDYKLKEAKTQAQELGKQISEVGSDVGKGLTGVNIGALLGIGGAIVAAKALGDALVDASKEGFKAFQAYSDAVSRFKFASVGTSAERGAQASEVAEKVEALAGAFNFDQLASAALSLKEASEELNKSPDKLGEMLSAVNTLAEVTQSTPEVVAEAYRKFTLGLKETGGGGTAASRFMKSTPGLEEGTRELQATRAKEFLGGRQEAQLSAQEHINYRELAEAQPADFWKIEGDKVGPKELKEEMDALLKSFAESPKAKEAMAERAATHPEDALNAAIEKIRVAFGDELHPAIDDLVKEFTAALPEIKDGAMDLAAVFKSVIPIIGFSFEALRVSIDAVTLPFGMLRDKIDSWLGISKATADAKALSEGVDKRLSQGSAGTSGGYTSGLYFGENKHPEATEKEKAASDADARKANELKIEQEKFKLKESNETSLINLKASAEHSAHSARLALEEKVSAMHQAAQVNALNVAPGVGKTGEEQQKVAREVIKINDETAEKIARNDAESADKIAKIKAEVAERVVKREEESAGKTGVELDSLHVKWAAEDASAAQNVNDILNDGAQKNRDANEASAAKIIDAQLTAAKAIIDEQAAAADKAIDAEKGPTADKGPEANNPETYNKYDKKTGKVHEGSHEKRIREEQNAAAQKAFEEKKEQQKAQVEAKRVADIAAADKAAAEQERWASQPHTAQVEQLHALYTKKQPTALPSMSDLQIKSHTDAETGQKSTSFDFGKGISEQQKTNAILEALFATNERLLEVFLS